MRNDQLSEIRTLLRSGEAIEIGGRQKRTSPAAPTTAGLVAAFAAIYLIWGSTYLAIRYAVETFPPLLMMGVRHVIAGAVLYGWSRWRGIPSPRLREWVHPALIGTVLFVGGHGSLAWAEQRVPSGIAALLVATLPMWVVVLARLKGTERKLNGRAWTGLVLGFIGVGVLFGPDVLRHNQELNLLSSGAVLFGTFIWAAGTIYMRSVKMPDSAVISSGMQMFAGGMSLMIAATLTGETGRFQIAAVTGRSWLALAYLIVFGSIIAFTAYSWLHTVASPSRVSTYAYVNPVVAVLIGWALASEPIGIYTVLAMVIILLGVGLVNAGHKGEHAPARSNGETEPETEEAVA
ncbi:MAG TPA: EamA family transporter [Bryobacteraceae bacterium]|nr:EamA family transporter [Bryobacteraceae bacterium]